MRSFIFSFLVVVLLFFSSVHMADAQDNSTPLFVNRDSFAKHHVPVLVIKFFPLDDAGELDRAVVGSDFSYLPEDERDLSSIRERVDYLNREGIALMKTASKYKGRENSVPSLEYSILDQKEYLEPVPSNGRAGSDKIAYLNRENICDYVDNQGVRQVWVWMYHNDGSMNVVESNMAMGRNVRAFWNFESYGDVSNSYREDDLPTCQNTYTVYEFNYLRDLGEMVENVGHQFEHLINYFDGRDTTPSENWDELLFWGKFVGSNFSQKIVSPGCGWVHYAPNSIEDYDWYNENATYSDCEDWKPDGSGQRRQVSCHTWSGASCTRDGGVAWKKWWMQRIPGQGNGLAYNERNLKNWWDLMGDFDAAIAESKSLVTDNPVVGTVGFVDNDDTFLINASLFDKGGVSSVKFRVVKEGINQTPWMAASLNSGSVQNGFWGASFNKSGLAEGKHDVFVRAADVSGNTAFKSVLTIKVGTLIDAFVNPSDNLQDVIDRSRDGDVIAFASGTYTSPLLIDKSISLISTDRRNTIFRFDKTQPFHEHGDAGIVVKSYATFLIDNFTFDFSSMPKKPGGMDKTAGIYLYGSPGSQANISNNVIGGMGNPSDDTQIEYSIQMETESVQNASTERALFSIVNNNLTNPGNTGIRLYGWLNALIQDNTITESTRDFAYGIVTSAGAEAHIANNNISGFNHPIGIGIAHASNRETAPNLGRVEAFANIDNNRVTGSTHGIVVGSSACYKSDGTELDLRGNITRNNISDNTVAGVVIISCSPNRGQEKEDIKLTLEQNTIKNNGDFGIYVSNDFGQRNYWGNITLNAKSNIVTGHTYAVRRIVRESETNGVLHGTVNATHNYWGVNEFRQIANMISGEVSYFPWYSDQSLQNTAKRFTITQPEDQSTVTGDSVLIRFSAIELGRLEAARIKLNKSNQQPTWLNANKQSSTTYYSEWSANFDSTTLADGKYDVTVYARDNSNNELIQKIATITIYNNPNIHGRCNLSNRGCITGTLNDTLDNETHYRWECRGVSGGRTVQCHDLRPIVNGVCNNAIKNGCTLGNLSDTPDNETHYRWECRGVSGGRTVQCHDLRPIVNGVCNNAIKNGCTLGNLSDTPDNETHYRWECRGVSNGSTVPCQSLRTQIPYQSPSQPISGVCGNEVDTCGAGNRADVADNETHYRWECRGVSGGDTVQCHDLRPIVNGVCNNAIKNGCTLGNLSDTPDNETHYRWECRGVSGGDTVQCHDLRPIVNGVCNNAIKNGCTLGNLSDTPDNETHYRWECRGVSGGDTVQCHDLRPIVNGVCNNAIKNGCTLGNLSDTPDNETHYRWECRGVSGGSTVPCQSPIPSQPVNGVCSSRGAVNECDSGHFNHLPDNETHRRWSCTGINTGNSATCNLPITHGVCGPSVDACSAGMFEQQSDSNARAKWRCVGSNGGSTASCELPIIHGACGISNSVCKRGKSADLRDSSTHVIWQCLGENTGKPVTCKLGITHGMCDIPNMACAAGDHSGLENTAERLRWQCTGRNSGRTETCEVEVVHGQCSTSRVECSSGTFVDLENTATLMKWKCVGSNTGNDSTCEMPVVQTGVCSSEKNKCAVGYYIPRTGTSTHYRWYCQGADGGGRASCSLPMSDLKRHHGARLFVSLPVFEKSCASPGESTFIYVSVTNRNRETIRNVRITAAIPELDAYATSEAFDVQFGKPASKLIYLDVPADAHLGQHYARVEVASSEDSVIKHSFFEVSLAC